MIENIAARDAKVVRIGRRQVLKAAAMIVKEPDVGVQSKTYQYHGATRRGQRTCAHALEANFRYGVASAHHQLKAVIRETEPFVSLKPIRQCANRHDRACR